MNAASVTPEALVLGGVLLALAAGIVSDRLRSDVAALAALVSLVLIQKLPGLQPIISEQRMFRGFASDAVITLVSVMIISAALSRSGILNQLADGLLRVARKPVLGVGGLLAGFGVMSAGLQNAGATAMAIPVARRFASRTGLEENALLIPAGIMVLLGGSSTLIGNSAMLLVNDLLPASEPRLSWWAPLPVGSALIILGIVYIGFRLRSTFRFTQPAKRGWFREIYHLEGDIRLVRWPPATAATATVGELREGYALRVAGLFKDALVMAPQRDRAVAPGCHLAMLGPPDRLAALSNSPDLALDRDCRPLQRAVSREHAGVVELVLPPGSSLASRTAREIRFRHRFGLVPLAVYRDQGLLSGDFRGVPLQAGDTVLAYVKWRDLERLPPAEDAVLISPVPPRPAAEGAAGRALLVLLVTVALGLWLDPELPTLMLCCALLMILAGVVAIDDAYRAVSWQTVFMIGALFPLSDAMLDTGASGAIAASAGWLLGDTASLLAVMTVCACAASLLSLILANVASVFIIAPVAVELAQYYQYDAATLVLLVAVSTANTFIMPNNQVTSLVGAAGGFRAADFFRSCWPLQLIFIGISVAMFAWMYPVGAG